MIENIPFHDDMMCAIMERRKFATSRNRNYGTGERSFTYCGHKVVYDVFSIIRITLEDVATNHYKAEGFNTREEFIAKWNVIHPGKKFIPTQRVWYHMFDILSVD